MKFKRILLCTLFMIPLISFNMLNVDINNADLAFANKINGFFNLDSNGDSCYTVDSIINEELVTQNLKDSIKQCLVEEVEKYLHINLEINQYGKITKAYYGEKKERKPRAPRKPKEAKENKEEKKEEKK